MTWIRSQGSPQEVAEILKTQVQQLRHSRSEETPSADGEADRWNPAIQRDSPLSPTDRHKRLMSINVLTDAPIFDVPARPWTEVTDNDQFVSHLISLYFTWIHQPAFVVGSSPFVEAMKLQDLGSDICSPLLVNMMLALACVRCSEPFHLLTHRIILCRDFPNFRKLARCLTALIVGACSSMQRHSDYGKSSEGGRHLPMRKV